MGNTDKVIVINGLGILVLGENYVDVKDALRQALNKYEDRLAEERFNARNIPGFDPDASCWAGEIKEIKIYPVIS